MSLSIRKTPLNDGSSGTQGRLGHNPMLSLSLPERRFKLYARAEVNHGRLMILCWSADGFDWKTDGKHVTSQNIDGTDLVIYDEQKDKYIVYGRGKGGRVIARKETDSLETLLPYEFDDIVIRTDYLDNYDKLLDEPMILSKDRIDSYDGNELYHYRGNSHIWHGNSSPEEAHLSPNPYSGPYGGSIHRLKLRLDGYMSADAGNSECTFVTPPLVFKGSKLSLNVDTSASGHLRVELMDADSPPGRGAPLPGFTLGDSERIVSNSCSRIVNWNGSSDVSAWEGKPIRLRISMRNTKLYAFQFKE